MDTVQMYIGSAAQMYTYILIEMSPNLPDEAKNSKTVLYNLIGTVVYQIRKLDISCPELKWDSGDEFQRQYFPFIAFYIRDYPEQLIVAQVSYGLYPICEIPQGVSIGYWTFQPLN